VHSTSEESEDPFEVAASLTEEDWKRLESSINNNILEITFPLGALVMVSSLLVMAIAIRLQVSVLVSLAVFIPGSAIPLIGWKIANRSLDDRRQLNWLLYEELTHDVRILPEWFRIEDKLVSTAPYREPPEYTDAEWEKLTRATRGYGKRFLLVFVPFMVIFIVILWIPSLLDVAHHWALIAMTPLLWHMVIHGAVIAFRSMKVRTLMRMESWTGREVIPERHRARIGKTWLRSEEEFEKKLESDCRER
jgi:ABC-type transport system involved in cytochrome bd biosynthesis fused ATPase/permease subunit